MKRDSKLDLHHIVVLVKDLKQAAEDYEKLGFTVALGGSHFGGISQNALIRFKDGTYIELLAIKPGINSFLLRILYKARILSLFRKSKYGMALRFYGRAFKCPEGIIDFAMLSSNLSVDLLRIAERGLFLTKPLPAGRYRPDGRVLRWKMLTPLVEELPFLITDIQPAGSPGPSVLEHDNGVSGLEGIFLVTAQRRQQTIRNFQNLLEIEPVVSEKLDYSIFRFSINNHFVEILMSNEPGGETKEIKKHGAGLYAIKFKGNDEPLKWNLKLSHGVIIFD